MIFDLRIPAAGVILSAALGLAACDTVPTSQTRDAGVSADGAPNRASFLHVTSKTPYPIPASLDASNPPAGYELFMIQHIARHGSRGLSSADDDDLTLQMLERARAEGALTPLGEKLIPEVKRVMAVHEKIGYGQLSGLGKREHREMAERLVERYKDFFQTAAEQGKRVSSSHSGRDRAAESGTAFFEGWLNVLPEYASLIDEPVADPARVYFNDYGAPGEAYEDYVDNDPRILAVLDSIENHPRSVEIARNVMLALFDKSFVDKLEREELVFVATADDEDRIETLADAMDALYGLYVIAAGLQDEDSIDFSPFIPEEYLAWLAYVDDAGSFYERGPSFADSDMTYRNAAALVEDMIEKLQRAARGERNYVGDFRFSHAQALMPLAAFLGIEGASEGVNEEQPYHYDSHPWRAEWVSPMAANVQWEGFINDQGEIVVRMLHNEKQARFAKDCEPLAPESYYYPLDELERCLLDQDTRLH